ncbi:MAG: NifU family protein [Acidiferrobacterales bacterium]
MSTADDHPIAPVRFFTDEELDALEQVDPDWAFRIARAQAMAARAGTPPSANQTTGEAPDTHRVKEAVEDVRQILMRDGGDIELVEIKSSIVRVRMKGACVGCPNSVLDLKNVVEKVILAVPGVTRVENTF